MILQVQERWKNKNSSERNAWSRQTLTFCQPVKHWNFMDIISLFRPPDAGIGKFPYTRPDISTPVQFWPHGLRASDKLPKKRCICEPCGLYNHRRVDRKSFNFSLLGSVPSRMVFSANMPKRASSTSRLKLLQKQGLHFSLIGIICTSYIMLIFLLVLLYHSTFHRMVFCKFVSELAIKRVTFLELKNFRHEKSKQPLEPTGRCWIQLIKLDSHWIYQTHLSNLN